MILVNLTAATICFLGECHPALIGKTTPVGEYQLNLRITDSAGYGGDVLQFLDEGSNGVLAIHRVWLLKPHEKRIERLLSSDPKAHIITNGCINVMPDVYEKLKDCCSNDKLVIER